MPGGFGWVGIRGMVMVFLGWGRGRPRGGGDVAVFKRFVMAVYEEKRYYNENNGGDENDGGENDSVAAPAAARPLPSAAAATDR